MFARGAGDFKFLMEMALKGAKMMSEEEEISAAWFSPNKKAAHIKVLKEIGNRIENQHVTALNMRLLLKAKTRVVVCFYCGHRWHFQEKCRRPRERRCFNCGNEQCPKRAKSYQCTNRPWCLVCNEPGHNVFEADKCRLGKLGRGGGGKGPPR